MSKPLIIFYDDCLKTFSQIKGLTIEKRYCYLTVLKTSLGMWQPPIGLQPKVYQLIYHRQLFQYFLTEFIPRCHHRH